MSSTLNVLLLIAALMLAAATASADDTPPVLPVDGFTVVSQPAALPDWTLMAIRGEAAERLFSLLPESAEHRLTRPDGTSYRARVTQTFGCVHSGLFGLDKYACGSFVSNARDGTLEAAVIDPEMGGTARIGVSN